MDAQIYRPEFDPAAGLWFLPTGEEARTIAELRAGLGPGAVIADYYPAGSRAPLFEQIAPHRLRVALSGAPLRPSRPRAQERNYTRWTADRVRALSRLVDQGATARQISVELGVTRGAALHQCERLGLKLKSRGGYSVRFATDAQRS